MMVFCPRRIAIVWLSSRSAGWARRMTSFRSSGRPANPVPSSDRISRKRSLYGRRMTVFTRSGGIVDAVWPTGTRPPSGIARSDRPASQSTKYSPISDWARTSQRASLRRESKPGSVTSAVATTR